MIEIVAAESTADLGAVRALMRAFVGWHRERNAADLELIDRYFDGNAFEEELAALPGKYSPPGGRLLLARCDGEPAGCVALRAIDAHRCEMKRMFVYPTFQGRRVGRALAERVIHEAGAAGYSAMLLDTSFRQVEAQGLYRALGFERCDAYYEMPDVVRDWLVFMRLDLRK